MGGTQNVNDSGRVFGDAETFIVTTPWLSSQTIKTPTITSNAYAAISEDNGALLLLDNSSTAMTLNINTGLGLSPGQRIDIIQTGAGQVTIGGTATINGTPGLKLRARYSSVTLICVSTNAYIAVGDLSA
jgi:hypothetical protein